MIRNIYSDLKSFKKLHLQPGLNILLADRSQPPSDKSRQSPDKKTRNGAGKTSLIELIHFVFGANAGKDSIFRSEKLAPWHFGMEFDLDGKPFAVERSGTSHGKTRVTTENASFWSLQSPKERKIVKNTRQLTLTQTRWNATLGEIFFALKPHNERDKYSPSFRSLFSYFVRREDARAFTDYLSQSTKQQIWDQQVAISHLLGLDWSISQRFNKLREQEKTIRELKKTLQGGTLPGFFESSGSLQTKLTLEENKSQHLKKQLDNFNVLPEYQSMEKEASLLTQKMNRLGNENVSDRQLLAQLQESLETEKPPEPVDLRAMYDEAGVVLPDSTIRRFEEAIEFHKTIIDNRKAHLRSEMERTHQRITERDKQKEALEERRSRLMNTLKTGGALEQYTHLQEEYAQINANVEILKQKLLTAQKLESSQTKAKIERGQLQERLRQDFREHKAVLDEAIVLFEKLSAELYERERTGSFTFESTDNGPAFKVSIEAQRSSGIAKMQIFCFDLMLAIIASNRKQTPGFLVHDSHLFDGVDERQIARAIQVGRKYADQCGFQYLITLNSDILPRDEFERNFDVNQFILPQRLDDTPNGGLFGLRFNGLTNR